MSAVIYFTHWICFPYLIDVCIHEIFGIKYLNKLVISGDYFDERNANDSILLKYLNEAIIILFFIHMILKEMTNFVYEK